MPEALTHARPIKNQFRDAISVTQWVQAQRPARPPQKPKIRLINDDPYRTISDIKLKRTDTTLDLSQKAEDVCQQSVGGDGGGGVDVPKRAELIDARLARNSQPFFSPNHHSTPHCPHTFTRYKRLERRKSINLT
jgi:hypothetical protein